MNHKDAADTFEGLQNVKTNKDELEF